MGKSVLVIDDDDGFRSALASVLRSACYDVLEAADGRNALAVVEKSHAEVDLMVVDLCLPEVNGFEVIGNATRHKSDMKILATSAVYRDMYLEIAGTMGATETIRKQQPFDAGLWLAAVERLIGNAGDSETASS